MPGKNYCSFKCPQYVHHQTVDIFSRVSGLIFFEGPVFKEDVSVGESAMYDGLVGTCLERERKSWR